MLLFGGFTWGIGFEFGLLATGANGPITAANALGYALCGLTGFGLRRLEKHWMPLVAQYGGIIVGIAPALVLIYALLNEFRMGNYKIDSYFIARPGMGERGLGDYCFDDPCGRMLSLFAGGSAPKTLLAEAPSEMKPLPCAQLFEDSFETRIRLHPLRCFKVLPNRVLISTRHLRQGSAQVHMGIRIPGVLADGGFKFGDRFRKAARHLRQYAAQIVVRSREIWLRSHGQPIFGDRIFQPAHFRQRASQVVVRRREIGIDSQEPRWVFGNRFGEPAGNGCRAASPRLTCASA